MPARGAKRAAKLRRLRYALREVAQHLSPHKGVQKCGIRTGISRAVDVKIGFRGRAFFHGVHRCHSVWECPVCAQGIAMGRADELRAVLKHHGKTGGGDYLLTLTMPHDRGDGLAHMRKAVAGAWSKIVAGAPWKRLAKKLRLVGNIRGLEVTVGPSGWHVHLHVVMLTHRKLTRAEASELQNFVYARWVKAITGKGYRAPTRAHGIDLQHCRVAQYVTKLGLADELAKPAFKAGRTGRRTPFQLLADIRRENMANRADLDLWLEYAGAMRGAKQLTWSRARGQNGKLVSLYKLFGVKPLDESQLSFEPGADESARTVYTIELEEWRRFVAWDVRLRVRILEIAERYPQLQAEERILDAIERVKGLEPVPFTIDAPADLEVVA